MLASPSKSGFLKWRNMPKRWQYQVKAEPILVPTTSIPGVIDKWAPTYPDKIYLKEGLLEAIQSGSFWSDLRGFHVFSQEFEIDIEPIIRFKRLQPVAPEVKGMSPRPGETAVGINKPVSFYIVPGMIEEDDVDISSIRVTVNGTEYNSTDPEFSAIIIDGLCFIAVDHPDWTYEQVVSVAITASSISGLPMTEVDYSFTTEWESNKTRSGEGRIELYPAADYSFDILTLEEDWVRQGHERYSPEIEIWWGMYQKLPYIENLRMTVEAGDTNALGKEVLDNGWLSAKLDAGEFVPIYSNTEIEFGPMFTNTKRSLFFKLLVPESAATKKYFVLRLKFTPEVFFPYGGFPYNKGLYSNAGNMIELASDKHIYRSYVFDAAMWNKLHAIGIVASPVWRGEDKKW